MEHHSAWLIENKQRGARGSSMDMRGFRQQDMFIYNICIWTYRISLAVGKTTVIPHSLGQHAFRAFTNFITFFCHRFSIAWFPQICKFSTMIAKLLVSADIVLNLTLAGMIDLFKNLADQAHHSVEAFKNDFETLREHYSFTGDQFSASMIHDKLREQIDQLLMPDNEAASIKRKSLQDLMAALVYESVLSDLDNTEYLSLLKIITSKEPRYRPLIDTTAWIEAIAHAKDFALIYPDYDHVSQEKLR
jgi:hypothetical protein